MIEFLPPFEVSSLGDITSGNKKRIEATVRKFNIKLKKQVCTDLAKISLLCTMAIFHSYQTTEWVNPPLLGP